MSGGGSGGGSTTSQTNLPKWLEPYAKSFIQSYGQQAFGPGFQPGQPGTPIERPEGLDQQVAGFDPSQEAALGNIEGLTPAAQETGGMGALESARTLGGGYLQDPTGANPYFNPLNRSVSGQFAANPIGDNRFLNRGVAHTASGAFLHPSSNPYLRGTYGAAASDLVNAYRTATAPSIQAQASRMGQFGSSAMNEAMALSQYGLGRNLENLSNQIYGENYQQERDRMVGAQEMGAGVYDAAYGRERGLQEGAIQTGLGGYQTGYENERQRMLGAMGQLPTVLESLYYPQQTLYGAGASRQGQEQAELDTGYSNAVSQAEWPFNILSGFGGALGQAGSGAGTSTTRSSGGGK